MALAIVPRERNLLDADPTCLTREDVLAHYRHLREISKQHHHEILKRISGDALIQQGRRLGLAHRKTFVLDDPDEMFYVYDLAIYTAPPDRSRAIDRYARSARFDVGSDEALMLEAMRAARFSVLRIEQRRQTAGLIATDLFRDSQIWLVDMGLERSVSDGEIIATRWFTPGPFSMTAGVFVTFQPEMLGAICDLLPQRVSESKIATVTDDRRFAESLYKIALADGVMDRVRYQDLPANT